MSSRLINTIVLFLFIHLGKAQMPMDLFGQRMPKPMTKIFSGSLLPLSGHSVSIKLVCDSMLIEGMSEEKYIEQMVSFYDAKKTGKGNEWKQKWENYRHSAFEKTFFNSLSVASSGSNVKWTNDTVSDFVIRVQVTAIINQATMSDEDENASPAEQIGTITVLHSISTVNNRTGEQICVLSCDNVPGGPSFDDCQRVLGCFSRLGTELGKMVMKKYR
jgi:hypothetical protein